MARATLRRCVRCKRKVRGKCHHCQPEISREMDYGRESRHERGYGTAWTKARNAYIAQHPLCVCCAAKGKVAGAEVVDHIQPHRGNWDLLTDPTNLQSLCRSCHDSDKRKIERTYSVTEVPRQWARYLATLESQE